jgi:hypothetical protein
MGWKYVVYIGLQLGSEEIFNEYGISLNVGTLNQDFTACN